MINDKNLKFNWAEEKEEVEEDKEDDKEIRNLWPVCLKEIMSPPN